MNDYLYMVVRLYLNQFFIYQTGYSHSPLFLITCSKKQQVIYSPIKSSKHLSLNEPYGGIGGINYVPLNSTGIKKTPNIKSYNLQQHVQ